MPNILKRWRQFLRGLFASKVKTIRRAHRTFRPKGESLERRDVPDASFFSVNTLSDLPDPTPNDGILDDVDPATPGNQYSLRGAIQTANSNNNPNDTDQINFAIPVAGTEEGGPPPVKTITMVNNVLPDITQRVTINAAGGLGGPTINLDGNIKQGNGFTIQAGGVTIAGFAIYNFAGNGVFINNPLGSASCQVYSCYVGTDVTGMAEGIGNTGWGISIEGPDNVIGSTALGPQALGSKNILSGNGLGGVRLSGAGATGNVVSMNYIGVKADGLTPLRNTLRSGVLIQSGASHNTIGGWVDWLGNLPRNVIAAGNRHGVEIKDSHQNKVFGNYIGLGKDGVTVRANDMSGVAVADGSTGNQIGQAGGKGNVISGNTASGVLILGSTTTGNTVAANHIGTDWTGMAAKPNGDDGVLISDSPNNTIGGAAAGDRNLISGNARHGVHVEAAGAQFNKIQGNYIGTKVNGNDPLGNAQNGVRLEAKKNTVGGDNAGEGNLISGNSTGVGVSRYAVGGQDVAPAEENVIAGNLIGTNAAGTAGVPNNHGVHITDASKNRVGGTGLNGRNIISGNTHSGVWIGTGASENVVVNNHIGTDPDGNNRVPNGYAGVVVANGATNTRIGGVVAGERNVISGNGIGLNAGYGVVVQDSGTTGTKIQGNYIGTKANGLDALGNNFDGIFLALGSSGTTIGGAVEARNFISGNGTTLPGGAKQGVGIHIHAGSTGNHVENNYVGKKANGANLPNVDGWWTADETQNTFLSNEHND